MVDRKNQITLGGLLTKFCELSLVGSEDIDGLWRQASEVMERARDFLLCLGGNARSQGLKH